MELLDLFIYGPTSIDILKWFFVGYAMPPVVMPPGASSVSVHPNGLPMPPASNIPSSVSSAPFVPGNAPPGSNPGGYLGNPTMTGSA